MESATLRPTAAERPALLDLNDQTALTIKAYFLVQTESRIDFSSLLESIQGVDGVTSAVRVIGAYDIIAEAEAIAESSLAATTSALSGVDGVIRVITTPESVVSRDVTGSPRAA